MKLSRSPFSARKLHAYMDISHRLIQFATVCCQKLDLFLTILKAKALKTLQDVETHGVSLYEKQPPINKKRV